MRITLAITWILIGIFIMFNAFLSFENRRFGDQLPGQNLFIFIELIFGLAIVFSALNMIRESSKQSIGLKISSWIFILYGVSFIVFGGFDDTGIFGSLVVLLLIVVSITTLILFKCLRRDSGLKSAAQNAD